jgi:hypothetical protein
MNVSPFSIRLVDGLARSPTQALPQIKQIRARLKAQRVLARQAPSAALQSALQK